MLDTAQLRDRRGVEETYGGRVEAHARKEAMEFPPLASSFGRPGWVERDAGRGERAGQVVKAEEVPRWSLEVCAARSARALPVGWGIMVSSSHRAGCHVAT